jgi:hypothetical protein
MNGTAESCDERLERFEVVSTRQFDGALSLRTRDAL